MGLITSVYIHDHLNSITGPFDVMLSPRVGIKGR